MVPRAAVGWAVAVLTVVVAVCICLWDWLSDGASNSATIRNLGLFGIVPLSLWLATWRNGIAQGQAETARGSLLNERYQSGAQMLAGSTPLIRIGGIHALQQIAQESPDTHRRQAIRLLAAFVRNPPRDEDHDPLTEPAGDDVKSAVEAIDRCRSHSSGPLSGLDLRGAKLLQAGFYGISLQGADLTGAVLRGARLEDVDLRDAVLADADLRNAQLVGTEALMPCFLQDTSLRGANLSGAVLAGNDLRGSDLSSATLRGANLGGADLREADLTAADLTDASLAFAKLWGADLTGAILTNTDLTGAHFLADDAESLDAAPVRGLKQTQLDAAHAARERPPKLGDALRDAGSGIPLVWNRTRR